jgi:AcrR family transcriptional regulator
VSTVPEEATPKDPRSRILDAALQLMSDRGSAGTSMRRLATACDLNVATIYHYFPSKADILHAVIAERRYGDRMAGEMPPIDPSLEAPERMERLFAWLWEETRSEDAVLRLIVGEGLRGEETARRSARAIVTAVDRWLTDVLDKTFPELDRDAGETERAAGLTRRQLLGLVAESLATGEADGSRAARELANALFPQGS